MLYKLTWQTRHYDDEWGDQQFVIGDINACHVLYNSLITSYHPVDYEGPGRIRAVITAIVGESDSSANIVYEWGWPHKPKTESYK